MNIHSLVCLVQGEFSLGWANLNLFNSRGQLLSGRIYVRIWKSSGLVSGLSTVMSSFDEAVASSGGALDRLLKPAGMQSTSFAIALQLILRVLNSYLYVMYTYITLVLNILGVTGSTPEKNGASLDLEFPSWGQKSHSGSYESQVHFPSLEIVRQFASHSRLQSIRQAVRLPFASALFFYCFYLNKHNDTLYSTECVHCL